jgi:predicted helicase
MASKSKKKRFFVLSEDILENYEKQTDLEAAIETATNDLEDCPNYVVEVVAKVYRPLVNAVIEKFRED